MHSYQEAFDLISGGKNVQPCIPPGNKSNAYFLVDNTQNIEKLSNNKRCDYYDDCGVWDAAKGNSRKSIFVLSGGSLKEEE